MEQKWEGPKIECQRLVGKYGGNRDGKSLFFNHHHKDGIRQKISMDEGCKVWGKILMRHRIFVLS